MHAAHEGGVFVFLMRIQLTFYIIPIYKKTDFRGNPSFLKLCEIITLPFPLVRGWARLLLRELLQLRGWLRELQRLLLLRELPYGM